MGPLMSVEDKHHAPRQEVLRDYGEGMLFTMETRIGNNVVACFATGPAIRALQGRLEGGIATVFSERRAIFEEIASTLFDVSRANPVVIEENAVAHLARMLRPS